MSILDEHRELQAIAKDVLAEMAARVEASSTERSLAEQASALLAARGITETWYHDCPALVLLGSRSCESLSGRNYQPANEEVGTHNLVTVDLSPSRGGMWGDCARSIYVENGVARLVPTGEEFSRGHRLLVHVHEALVAFATPQTTFAEMFDFSNGFIADAGFESLDFLGNVGHSIPSRLEDRRFVTADEQSPLSSVPAFTFEPHVRENEGRWGYKHEEIYFFDDGGCLQAL